MTAAVRLHIRYERSDRKAREFGGYDRIRCECGSCPNCWSRDYRKREKAKRGE